MWVCVSNVLYVCSVCARVYVFVLCGRVCNVDLCVVLIMCVVLIVCVD